jgi:peptide methionine sulfoxide reductase msrA/msrB
VRVSFDPARTSYDRLLDLYFRLHDPTTKNQQGNDVGPQYRSSIFTLSPEQKKSAEKAKSEATRKWKKPAVTEIVELAGFTRAEDEHQDYLVKHPKGYTCHFVRDLPR